MPAESANAMIGSCQIGLLQVDLDHHSELQDKMSPGLLMEAKMQFARDLKHYLQSWRLGLINWPGDGGIFGIECSKVIDFDAVVFSGELVHACTMETTRNRNRQLPIQSHRRRDAGSGQRQR